MNVGNLIPRTNAGIGEVQLVSQTKHKKDIEVPLSVNTEERDKEVHLEN